MVFVSEGTLKLRCKETCCSKSKSFFLKQHASGLNLTCLSIIPTLPIGLTPGIGISFDYKHPTWTNWLLQFNENFIFIFISRFAWKCRILTCSLILCTWWLLQVPHPLYRPAQNRLIPCADSLCTALHSGLGSNKKCPSPKQCDYQIKYTDSASSRGVLINDNFSLPLKSSNIRPSLTFGYNTWVSNIFLDSVAGFSCSYGCFCLQKKLWVWSASWKKWCGASSDRRLTWAWEGIS